MTTSRPVATSRPEGGPRSILWMGCADLEGPAPACAGMTSGGCGAVPPPISAQAESAMAPGPVASSRAQESTALGILEGCAVALLPLSRNDENVVGKRIRAKAFPFSAQVGTTVWVRPRGRGSGLTAATPQSTETSPPSGDSTDTRPALEVDSRAALPCNALRRTSREVNRARRPAPRLRRGSRRRPRGRRATEQEARRRRGVLREGRLRTRRRTPRRRRR